LAPRSSPSHALARPIPSSSIRSSARIGERRGGRPAPSLKRRDHTKGRHACPEVAVRDSLGPSVDRPKSVMDACPSLRTDPGRPARTGKSLGGFKRADRRARGVGGPPQNGQGGRMSDRRERTRRMLLEELEQRLAPADLSYIWSAATDPDLLFDPLSADGAD